MDNHVGFATAATVPDRSGDFQELLFRSGDGGTTWQPLGKIAQRTEAWLQFVDARNGWAQAGSTLIRTIDGGITWNQVSLPGTQGLSYLDFLDPRTGFGVSGRQIYRTHDGTSWSVSSVAGAGYVTGLTFIDGNHGWALVSQSPSTPGPPVVRVHRSSDGGASWADMSAADRYDRSLCFSGLDNGWRMGGIASAPALGSSNRHVDNLQGSGARTADGGATWATMAMPVGLGEFDCLRTVDASHGWASAIDSSQNGFVLWTADAGQDWAARPLPVPPGGWYLCRQMLPDGHGWAVGNDGQRPALVDTSDGGATWREEPALG